MPRIHLRVYVEPEQAEVLCNVLRSDGTYERLAAVVDTGAAVSLMPNDLLNKVAHRLGKRGSFIVEQAGIANQSFQAVEGYVMLMLEDEYGQRTSPFEVLVWFADTKVALIGFADVLDRAILHIDMLDQRLGWLQIDA